MLADLTINRKGRRFASGLRDILRRHAISVAKRNIADIDRRPFVAEGDAFDPEQTFLPLGDYCLSPVFLAHWGLVPSLRPLWRCLPCQPTMFSDIRASSNSG
jgi:hypothetical protein